MMNGVEPDALVGPGFHSFLEAEVWSHSESGKEEWGGWLPKNCSLLSVEGGGWYWIGNT